MRKLFGWLVCLACSPVFRTRSDDSRSNAGLRSAVALDNDRGTGVEINIDRYSFLDELATIESLQLRVNPFCKRSA